MFRVNSRAIKKPRDKCPLVSADQTWCEGSLSVHYVARQTRWERERTGTITFKWPVPTPVMMRAITIQVTFCAAA